MRPCRNLGKLEHSARKRLLRLRGVASRVCRGDVQHDGEIYFSFVAIETLNTWRNYCRALYLSFTLDPRSTSGTRVTICRRGLTFNQAIGIAVRSYRRHAEPRSDGTWDGRDEPAWHVPQVLLRLCGLLRCSKLEDIQAAVSAGSRVFIDLPVFRNFYAHRNQQSQYAAMRLATQYGIPATFRPSRILASRPLGRPQPLVLDWIDDLLFATQGICG